MAQQLLSDGDEVALLVMVEPAHNNYPKYRPNITPIKRQVHKIIQRVESEVYNTVEISGGIDRVKHLWQRFTSVLLRIKLLTERVFSSILSKLGINLKHSREYSLRAFETTYDMAYEEYSPKPYVQEVVIFNAEKQPLGIIPDPSLGWSNLIKGSLILKEIPGHPARILSEPRVKILSKQLHELISERM
jgi:thioesterase domain-containing protein